MSDRPRDSRRPRIALPTRQLEHQRLVPLDESPFSMLKKYDFKVISAPTNDPNMRINAVEKRLIDRRAGTGGLGAAIVIDREACPTLVWGFNSDYKYRKKRDGELEDRPGKTKSSHVHDALQYACLGAQSNYIGRKILRLTRGHTITRQQPIPAAAWT